MRAVHHHRHHRGAADAGGDQGARPAGLRHPHRRRRLRACRTAAASGRGMDVDLCRGLAAAIFNDAEQGALLAAVLLHPLHRARLGRGGRAVPHQHPDHAARRHARAAACGDLFLRRPRLHGPRQLRRRQGGGDARRHHLPGAGHHERAGDGGLLPQHQHALPARCCSSAPTRRAAALQAGRCDSFGTDASQLAGVRSSMPNPADWTILPERFSKEPYGAYIRRDDHAVVRRGALVHHRADRGGGAGRHPRQCRGDAPHQRQPEYPPAAGRDAGAGRVAEARPRLGLQRRSARSGNYGELYDRHFGPRHAGRPARAGRTSSGPRAG